MTKFLKRTKLNIDLAVHGILPRTLSGLQGVFFSPFLHGDFSHIANNSIPLFILTTALIYFYREVSLKVLFYGILLSGFLTWVIGRNSYHIGASGLIYGFASFIFFSGLFRKEFKAIVLAIAIGFFIGLVLTFVFYRSQISSKETGFLTPS